MWTIIQHMPWEGPGLIAEVMAERGLPHRICRTDRGDPLPAADDLDGLVVMGGTMGVYEADRHPHLRAEMALLRAAIARGAPVLGVCLGAQLMAAALGADVYQGPVFESGDGTVRLTPAGRADRVMGGAGGNAAPEELAVVHWHQDTFPLPPGATLLASTDLYAQQAFRVGARAYAWQFHPEVTAAMAAEWRAHGLVVSDAHVMRVEAEGRNLIRRFFNAVS